MLSPLTSLIALSLVAFVAAGVITNVLVPLVIRLARGLEALDHPGERKLQEWPVPRLGGVAIVGGIALAGGGAALVRWVELSSEISRSEVLTLAVACGIVFLLGIADDLNGVAVWQKFAVEIFAAMLLVGVGWSVPAISLPGGGHLELGWFGPVLAVVWVVGVTNAFNLLDGLDGLAGGVAAIVSVSLLAYALLLGNPGTVLLMAAVAGACVGFLRHNWSPARIFMGDSGSLTLGFLLAAVTLHSSIKAPAAVALVVPVLALGLPVIDTLLVMGLRFLARPHGRLGDRFLAMFHADRQHLHHLMLHYGASRERVVFWLYMAAIAFCAFAILVAVTQNPILGLVLLPIELAVIAGMRHLGLRRATRRLAESRPPRLRVPAASIEGAADEEPDAAEAAAGAAVLAVRVAPPPVSLPASAHRSGPSP